MIKVLAIDGMLAPKIIWNSLIRPMQKRYEFAADYCEWQDWGKHVGTAFDVVIGHSLGGDSAIRLCRYFMKYNVSQPKLLMTLAARHQSWTSYLDFLFPLGLQNFTAPNSVTHNFYTWAPLPSSPIKGAVENVNCTSLWINHGSLPAAPQVHACLSKFLEEHG